MEKMHSREHYIGAAVTFAFVTVILTLTMAPTVTFWDAGEFIAASYTLGIPHPPGTPLFVILGRTISVLPLPFSVAERLNFLSVLCGAVSAMLLYLIAVKIIEKWVPDTKGAVNKLVVHGGALAAAFIPPFLFTVWSNCTEAEVYAIATATMVFVAWLVIYMGSLKDRSHIKNVLLLVVYIVSLSLGNHMIVMLVTPGVIVYVLIHDWNNRGYWLSVLGCFTGAYLLVMKGMNLSAVFTSLSRSGSDLGLFTSLYLYVAGALGVLAGFADHVASWPAVFFGVMILAGSLFWASREKSIDFFLASLGLFLLGFSIHLYLLIRAGHNPMINEGAPDNLQALWAVIGREQYGSAYGLLPRQVWSMITGKIEVAGVADLIQNVKVFFQYNIPFYTKYFGWQFGNPAITGIFFVVGVYGAVEHYLHEKKSFWFWLTTFLFTGLILNVYMNFKLGYTQALDRFPDLGFHEVRERDYFFIVSFLFFGFWAGLGLAGIVNRMRKAFQAGTERAILNTPAFVVIGALLLTPALLPMYLNWDLASRAGNYVPPNYASNIMNSMQPDGILFTNGDNDTFPLWYIQEVEYVRKDCRVVNLSLLNTTWYIKQMRDLEPKVPISYTDEQIANLQPFRLDKEMRFRFGELELTFPEGYIMYVKDLMLLDILRTNNWEKPLYFTTTVPPSNRANLDPYLTMVGSVFRIHPRKAEEMAATDDNLLPLGENGICLDIEETRRLVYEVYNYDSFFREIRNREDADTRLVEHFAAPFAYLGNAYLHKGMDEEALDANLRARSFMQDRHRWDFALATLYSRAGQYDNALAMLDSFAGFQGQVAPVWYSQLAQYAVNNDDYEQAAMLVERSLEIDPRFREGYAGLFMIFKSAGNTEMAIRTVERFIEVFPENTTAAGELDKFRETGDFDTQAAFGVTVR